MLQVVLVYPLGTINSEAPFTSCANVSFALLRTVKHRLSGVGNENVNLVELCYVLISSSELVYGYGDWLQA
jgi:hypothetical protein